MSDCFLLLMRALFEWPNHYEALPLITFQILITLKLLLNLRANLITNMNSLISTIPSPHTERQTKKAAAWYKTVAELPNAVKLLQIYRMEKKHWESHPCIPAKSIYAHNKRGLKKTEVSNKFLKLINGGGGLKISVR